MRTSIRRPLSAAAVVTAGLALAACSNPIDNIVDNVVEDAVEEGVEQATGVDVEVGDNASIPNGFPDELPQPDATLVAAVGVAEGYQLNYTAGDIGPVEGLVEDLAGVGGLEQTGTSDLGELRNWTFESDQYTVNVTAIIGDDEVQIGYMVILPSEEE